VVDCPGGCTFCGGECANPPSSPGVIYTRSVGVLRRIESLRRSGTAVGICIPTLKHSLAVKLEPGAAVGGGDPGGARDLPRASGHDRPSFHSQESGHRCRAVRRDLGAGAWASAPVHGPAGLLPLSPRGKERSRQEIPPALPALGGSTAPLGGRRVVHDGGTPRGERVVRSAAGSRNAGATLAAVRRRPVRIEVLSAAGQPGTAVPDRGALMTTACLDPSGHRDPVRRLARADESRGHSQKGNGQTSNHGVHAGAPSVSSPH
jgi:hypothetical protein